MTDRRRACFVLQLRPDRVDDYLDAHTAVWPEMLDALRDTGWHNYSLFLRPEDGMVIGYVETDDLERTTKAMEATDVNARWQAHMAEFFLPPAGGASASATSTAGANPDTIRTELIEYFHLD